MLHYIVHRIPLLDRVMDQLNSVQTIYCRYILILYYHLDLSRLNGPSGVFDSDLPTEILYAFFIFTIHAICLLGRLTVFHLNILIIFYEECCEVYYVTVLKAPTL